MSIKQKFENFDKLRFLRQVIVCGVGMFIYATGIALTKNCNLGISPIVSVAYALSLITPISMGWCSTIFNFLLFAFQRIILKKEYSLGVFIAQLIMSMVFSVFIDWTALVWSFVQPQTYVWKIIIFVIGCFVLAIGVVMVVSVGFVVLSAEGCVAAVTKKSKWKFGNVKIGFDAACVLITVILSLIFLGKIEGIREGTLIAVLTIGTFTKFIGKVIVPPIKKFIGPDKNAAPQQ